MPGVLSRRVAEQCRVVVDNDFAGDPDGILALAHHLLSPSNRVVAITSSFLDPQLVVPPATPGATAQDGARLAAALLGRARPGRPAAGLHRGGGAVPRRRAGPRRRPAIVAAAREESDLPLYLVCAGPLTNVAAALALDPGIVERLTLVWIGGSLDAEAYEYNRDTDPAAAEAVFGTPGPGDPPVPAGDLPAVRLLDRRARGRPAGDRAAGCLAVRPVLLPAGVGAARRRVADRRQPAGADHGAHHGQQHPVGPVRRRHRLHGRRHAAARR